MLISYGGIELAVPYGFKHLMQIDESSKAFNIHYNIDATGVQLHRHGEEKCIHFFKWCRKRNNAKHNSASPLWT